VKVAFQVARTVAQRSALRSNISKYNDAPEEPGAHHDGMGDGLMALRLLVVAVWAAVLAAGLVLWLVLRILMSVWRVEQIWWFF
jgi:hypothetical protein